MGFNISELSTKTLLDEVSKRCAIKFNYNKLRGRIREVFGAEYKFAKALKLPIAKLSRKLNGVDEFTLDEINKTVKLLDIPENEIDRYFFTPEVQFPELM